MSGHDEPGLAIGLMSGTSLDGIDVALVRSDGEDVVEPLGGAVHPYEEGFRARLRGVLGGRGDVLAVERELTDLHAAAVESFLAERALDPVDIRFIGFHGHTILHAPEERRTWQIGDGQRLADRLGLDVVADFRTADVAAGGEGAPLAPLYHAARARDFARPLAVLNVGGVANVTWIGEEEADLLAFDTGPGNALIDDWVARHGGGSHDTDGHMAARGRADETRLAALLEDPYFAKAPPKSLDRDRFSSEALAALEPADGAATLTAFTAAAVAGARAHFPAPPRRWLVTGGGRHNPTLLKMLDGYLESSVEPVEAVGWNGDLLEAEAFAYLALRSARGLPITHPGTTGVRRPLPGGRLFTASRPRRDGDGGDSRPAPGAP